jgi:hypothetical protein
MEYFVTTNIKIEAESQVQKFFGSDDKIFTVLGGGAITWENNNNIQCFQSLELSIFVVLDNKSHCISHVSLFNSL